MKIVAKITLSVRSESGGTLYVPPCTPVDVSEDEARELFRRDLAVSLDSVTSGGNGDPSFDSCDDVDDVDDVDDDGDDGDDGDDDDGYDIIEIIASAIDDLPGDAFGRDGKPGVRFLSDLLDQSVSSVQRDKAWALYQELNGANGDR